jgi:heme-degrading monooxygenase HmoA
MMRFRLCRKEAEMTTVFVHHRVADYNTWRPEYDRVMAADWSKDIQAHRVWRGLDDPNLVIVATTFDSRQAAEAVFNNATLREAMRRGGVIESSVKIDYVDEVAAGTR